MAFEKECDDALAFMIDNQLFLPDYNSLKKNNIKILDDRFPKGVFMNYVSIVAILMTDELITYRDSGYMLTNKGLSFYHTDSFVKRAERWDLERRVKENELTKLTWEVSKLRSTFNMARLGVALAIISLVASTVIGIIGVMFNKG